MDDHEKTICRLCLQISANFKAIEKDMKNVFDMLLPKVDLTAVWEPVMCTNCAKLLIKCFDFKVRCINARDKIVQFVHDKDAVKMDPMDVQLNKNENVSGGSGGQDVCEFCMSPVEYCKYLDLKGRDIMLEKMMEQCLPELNSSIGKKFVICEPCHGSLQNCFHFVTNCLIVEEKIKKYRENLDEDCKGQIDLRNLLEPTMRDVTTSEVDGNLVIIKTEKAYCEGENSLEGEIGNAGDMFKLEHMFCENSGNVKEEAEHEIKNFVGIPDLKFDNKYQITPEYLLAYKEEGNLVVKTEETFCGENELSKQNFVEMEDQNFVFNEEVEIKKDEPECYSFDDGVVLPQSDVNTAHTKQASTNKNIATTTLFQCEYCLYQLKNKYNLQKHLLLHKDPSEVTMYKCDHCTFQAKRKDHLKQHSLKHKDPSEITMYRCTSCSYQARNKYYLEKHLLEHKDPSEIPTYKCGACPYQAKTKSNLKIHMLQHKDSSEVTIYKCDSCSYQTKRKYRLKSHLLQHKDPSEVEIYKCDSCSYQAKRKDHLNRHLLSHKNDSEVTIYSCTSCPYQTKCIDYLKAHLRVHKDPSEVVMYKCESCSFRTKLKHGLKKHLLVHMDPSEVTLYKCDSCPFQTKHQYGLKTHLLVHNNFANVTVFKCDSCSFQSKYKNSLKLHCQKLHMNLS